MTYKERIEHLKSPEKMQRLVEAYQLPTPDACIHFIESWVMTYDPRLPGRKTIPFQLYPFQREYIEWLWRCYVDREEGAVEKSRDMGITWGFVAFSVWLMLFHKEVSVGFYSYKAHEVHKLGDISTLFGKVEVVLKRLPAQLRRDASVSLMYAKCPATGSDIAGDSGENPGRGGRRSVYFLDESAFYQHAESIYAAISENTDCPISVSTHAGTNTVFYNKVMAGTVRVYQAPWHLHPLHTDEWYRAKRKKAEDEGMLHIFQREVEMNAGASIENVVIPFEWVDAGARAEPVGGAKIAALDVADEGGDTNALIVFYGNQIHYIEERGEGDPIETTDWAFWKAVELGCEEFRYDNIGVGAGVKGRIKEIQKTTTDPRALEMKCKGWSAAGAVLRPKEMDYSEKMNKDMFANAKAQAWFRVRDQFLASFRQQLGKDHDPSKIICMNNPDIDQIKLAKLCRELSQPQHKMDASGRYLIDKKPKGTKSPNLADSAIMCRAEVEPEWIPWSTA